MYTYVCVCDLCYMTLCISWFIDPLFSNTDEVRVKTHHIEKMQLKLSSAEEDISDLNAEFEIDRQDYLDTIRKQEQRIQLQEQLLRTVIPCLRRDCNYFYIDKIIDECVWNEDQSTWVLPKLVLTKTSLSPVNSKATLLDKRGLHSNVMKQMSSPEVRRNASTLANATTTKGAHTSNSAVTIVVQPSISDPLDDSRLLQHFQKGGQSDYFRPKRALELMGHTKENSSPEHGPSLQALETSVSSNRKVNSTTSLTPNAATVHGIDTLSVGDSVYNRRPGKLQSLPGNPPLPSIHVDHHTTRAKVDILDMVEKRLSNRKRNSLEPLGDIKSRKPPH